MKTATRYGNILEIEITSESSEFVRSLSVYNAVGRVEDAYERSLFKLSEFVEDENSLVTLEIAVQLLDDERTYESMRVVVKSLDSKTSKTYIIPDSRIRLGIFNEYLEKIEDLELSPLD